MIKAAFKSEDAINSISQQLKVCFKNSILWLFLKRMRDRIEAVSSGKQFQSLSITEEGALS